MGLTNIAATAPRDAAISSGKQESASFLHPEIVSALLQMVGDAGFLVYDGDAPVYVDAEFAALTGYSQAEWMANPSPIRIAPNSSPVGMDIHSALSSGVETAIYHRNGSRVELDVRTRTVRVNGRLLRVVLCRRSVGGRTEIRQTAFPAEARQVSKWGSVTNVESLNARIASANRELAHSFEMLREQGLQNRRTEEQLRRVIASARCLLWHGRVFREGQGYRWSIRPLDETAAMRFLPLDTHEGERFFDAKNRAVLPEDYAEMNSRANAAFDAGASQYYQEFRCRDATGSVHWLYEDVFVERVAEGEWRVVGVCTDVTEQKRRESEITQLNARLQATNDELAESLAELQQFAYIASHDLQEPLRTVTNYLQLLERRYGEQFDEEGKTFLTFAVDAAKRMGTLWRDMLDYSRLHRSETQMEEMDGEAILKGVLTGLQSFILEQQGEITHDPLPTVVSDRVQFGRVLSNLIMNALKYRRETPPRIHIAAKRGQREWVFTVRDNGVGIEEQYYDRIFVMFQRLHDRKRYAGTGIGLAICKKIVERQGGRIWVESQVGVGSTFYFSIPDR